MKKWKLKDHVIDNMLFSHGFVIEGYWLSRHMNNLILVSIPSRENHIYKDGRIYVSQECASIDWCDVHDCEKYIQDLIDADLVEELKEK